MKTPLFLKKLKIKFKVQSDSKLASLIGVSPNTISAWKKGKEISETQAVNIIRKAADSAIENAIHHSVQPLVEMYAIEATDSRQGVNSEIISTDKSETYNNDLRKNLEQSKGIYFFYNSEGKVIYVGKTSKQNLWKEINSAFNRHRETQKVYLVNHPTTRGTFSPAHEKSRKMRKTNVYLYDLAVYFSAYKIHPHLISNIEALLIRALPNDLSNAKIESFKWE